MPSNIALSHRDIAHTNKKIELMSTVLSNKPLMATDIASIDDAKKELARIRALVRDYTSDPSNSSASKRNLKAKVREEDYVAQYVKQTFEKSDAVRELIYVAIKPNLLFEMCTEEELNELVDIFESVSFKKGDTVIKQGDMGFSLYVVEEGDLSVSVAPPMPQTVREQAERAEPLVIGSLSTGMAFGELALMYGSPRAATITALSDCKLWKVERAWYRGLIGQLRQKVFAKKLGILSNVTIGDKPLKKYFDQADLREIAQLMTVKDYNEGDVIIREGEEGDSLFIIAKGNVNIFTKASGDKAIPYTKNYFGEKALLSNDVRAATCVAASPLTCYLVTRADFNRVMGPLKEIFEGRLLTPSKSRRTLTAAPLNLPAKVKYELKDLKMCNVLGQGAFGKVKMVKAKDTSKFYAMKLLRKDYIIENKQQDVVLGEYKMLLVQNHPNIVGMHCAMQDPKYLYFLMDCLPGGELMDVLTEKGSLPEDWIKFYAASVLLAFQQIHAERIAYRDLKPENLVLDEKGYCIMIDFGIAKKCKGPTFTFTGTPDYLAPEVLQGTGYGPQCDYWALGVLMYELFVGKGPFTDVSQTSMMRNILMARVEYPEKMSPHLKELIHALLVRDPSKRLGFLQGGTEEVMKQRFFAGFDWDGLLKKTIPVPYKPDVPDNFEKIGSKDSKSFRDQAKKTDWVADI